MASRVSVERVNPITDTELPRRSNDREENELPRLAQSNTLNEAVLNGGEAVVASPSLTRPLTDKTLPKATKSRIEIEPESLVTPTMESLLPSLANDPRESELNQS